MVALRRLADQLEYDAVARAIDQGWTWSRSPSRSGHPTSRTQEARSPALSGAHDAEAMMFANKIAEMRTIKEILTGAEYSRTRWATRSRARSISSLRRST